MGEAQEVRLRKLEILKLELQISKSKTAKQELDFKIAQALEDIERMRDHQVLQDKVIADSITELSKLKGDK